MTRLLVVLLLVASLVFGGYYVYQSAAAPEVGPSTPFPTRPVKPSPPTPPAPTPVAKNLLLFFTQQGCQPCRVMEREMLDPAVAKALERYDVRQVEPRDGDLFRQYGVSATPTFVILGQDHQIKLAEQVGQMDPKPFADWLNAH